MIQKRKYWIRAFLLVFCFATVISLSSCSADMNVGNNTELGEQFMDCLIGNKNGEAYDLIKNTATPADFNAYWSTILPIAEGAETYEMEQIGWNISKSNGRTIRVTAYQVYLDNEKIALLRVTTYDDIEGIAGLHLSDITDFTSRTNSFVPGVKVGLLVISILTIAFCVWMFVDCLRRKIKRKALWIILLFFGISFTLTLGETVGFNFMLGLMFQINTIIADPGILAVKTKFFVPLGAILYFALRKKITIPSTSANDVAEPAEFSAMDSETEINISSSGDEE